MKYVGLGVLSIFMSSVSCDQSDTQSRPNPAETTNNSPSNADEQSTPTSLEKAKAWAKVAAGVSPSGGQSAKTVPSIQFATHQPGISGMHMRFLGWTEDENRFVVETTHATSWRYLDAGVASYTLYRVHDTLTGKLIRSFRKEIDGSPDSNDEDARAWNQAGSLTEWRAWKTEYLLGGPLGGTLGGTKSSRESEHWRMYAAVESGTLAAIDSLVFHKSKSHISIDWAIRKGTSKSTKPPKVTVSLEKDGIRNTALLYTLPFRIREFYSEFEGEITAKGTLKAYFSPKEKRVVFTTNFQLQVDNDAFPVPSGSYYVRSLGPQLKIVGSGGGRARALAAKLTKVGLPVTVIETSEVSVEKPMLYFRSIPATAFEKIQKVIPGIGLEKLQKKGWLDAIVILGKE